MKQIIGYPLLVTRCLLFVEKRETANCDLQRNIIRNGAKYS